MHTDITVNGTRVFYNGLQQIVKRRLPMIYKFYVRAFGNRLVVSLCVGLEQRYQRDPHARCGAIRFGAAPHRLPREIYIVEKCMVHTRRK